MVARWALAHRWIVVGVWLVLATVGGFAAADAGSHLSPRFDLPGQPAYETNTAIMHDFGNGGSTPPLVAVAQVPAGRRADAPNARQEIASAVAAIQATVPGTWAASITSHDPDHPAGAGSVRGSGFLSSDGRTTFIVLYPPADLEGGDVYDLALPRIEKVLSGHRVAGQPLRVTGASVLANGGGGDSSSVLAETLLAGVAALVVLGLVFVSVLAIVPLVISAVAIPSTFLVVDLLARGITMSSLVPNIVALIGLGVAIDYALLICTRWREERGNGRTNHDAVTVAMATAGGSVLFSGLTVAISLAALTLTRVPFLRSMGLAGLLIPLFSVAVSLTLLPVLLDAVGSRLEWPRRTPARPTSRLWSSIADRVVRHRILAAVASLALLGLLASPVVSLHLGSPRAGAIADTAPPEARAGYHLLVDSGLGDSMLQPVEVLHPATTTFDLSGVGNLRRTSPASWTHEGLRVTDVWTVPGGSASTVDAGTLLSRVQSLAADRPGVRVGGSLAQDHDFIHALYGPNLLVIVAAIVVVTFLLLARALHSAWLPVKALLLNVVSLASAFGVLTFIWQQGHATRTLFSQPATGAITLWVPLAVFALLFGLSMDYEVFILTRINEEYARTGEVDEAIVEAIGHTGRLVSSGALILCLAFVALGGVPVTDVKILSTGLAAGVIIDATVIRGVLAPALVALLGHHNWAMPTVMRRLLRITPMPSPSPSPSPLPTPPATPRRAEPAVLPARRRPGRPDPQ